MVYSLIICRRIQHNVLPDMADAVEAQVWGKGNSTCEWELQVSSAPTFRQTLSRPLKPGPRPPCHSINRFPSVPRHIATV